LRQVLPFDDFDFYLCGATGFMQSLYSGLQSLGVAEARIHYEFFGPAAVLKDESARAETELSSAGEHTVTFSRSGVTAQWDPKFDNLLDFAEAQGLGPNYSCRSGVCNTCKCALEDGEVTYSDEPLDDPGPENVLICTAMPTTNVVVGI